MGAVTGDGLKYAHKKGAPPPQPLKKKSSVLAEYMRWRDANYITASFIEAHSPWQNPEAWQPPARVHESIGGGLALVQTASGTKFKIREACGHWVIGDAEDCRFECGGER